MTCSICRSRRSPPSWIGHRPRRPGDFEGLLALLDPGAAVRVDPAAQQLGATTRKGASEVAHTFSGRAEAAVLALIDGMPGAVWSVRGEPRAVLGFTIVGGWIVEIELMADAARLEQLEVVPLPSSPGSARPDPTRPDPIPSSHREPSP